MTRVSPELVLVDPALREAALAGLPAPRDCLAARRPAASVLPTRRTAAPAPLNGDLEPASRPRGDLDHARRLRVAVSLLALVSGAFLFAYFLGAPVLELLEASRAALPI